LKQVIGAPSYPFLDASLLPSARLERAQFSITVISTMTYRSLAIQVGRARDFFGKLLSRFSFAQ